MCQYSIFCFVYFRVRVTPRARRVNTPFHSIPQAIFLFVFECLTLNLLGQNQSFPLEGPFLHSLAIYKLLLIERIMVFFLNTAKTHSLALQDISDQQPGISPHCLCYLCIETSASLQCVHCKKIKPRYEFIINAPSSRKSLRGKVGLACKECREERNSKRRKTAYLKMPLDEFLGRLANCKDRYESKQILSHL
jgi:hypothetical protein